MLNSEERERRRVNRRLWGPGVWLFLVYACGIAAITATVFLSPGAIGVGFLAFLFLVYFLYFWWAFAAVVEFQLWRRMRNLGHLLQFLGFLLMLTPIVWTYLPFLLGGMSPGLGPIWPLVSGLEGVAFPVGLVMALYGYYHRDYHASDVDMYRNVVVRAGEKVGALTDGYSTRVYETRYESFPAERVGAIANEYATRFQKGGFYLAHRTDETGITMYPVSYTGVGGLALRTAFAHLVRLARTPERLTWVRVEWTGAVRVHISPEDYRRIRRPVAHHILCAGVADAVVGSLLAYASGNETAAVANLLGPDRSYSAAALHLPTPLQDRHGRMVIALTLTLIAVGTGAAIGGWVVAQSPVSISGVHWAPQNPVPGQLIDVSATVVDLSGPGAFQSGPELEYWAYFNDTTNGSITLQRVQGDEYHATFGPFSEGTEVTFIVAKEMQATLGSWLVQSPAYILDIGNVPKGGSSGLAIQVARLPGRANGYANPIAAINSSSPIKDARLLVTGTLGYTMTNGGGGIGWTVLEFVLTGSGYMYTMDFPLMIGLPLDAIHARGTLDLKFVAKDATGNTATSELIVLEFNF